VGVTLCPLVTITPGTPRGRVLRSLPPRRAGHAPGPGRGARPGDHPPGRRLQGRRDGPSDLQRGVRGSDRAHRDRARHQRRTRTGIACPMVPSIA